MRAQFRARIRLLLAAVLCIALLIIVRLYFVQIMHGASYRERSEHQATGSSGLFDRGGIYFTRKDGTLISAATLATGYLVAVNPQLLEDPDAAYAAITAVATTSYSKQSFKALAGKKGQVYVEVAHRLSEEAGAALLAKDISGVEVLRERWRYYPGGSLASQTVGIVSYGSGDELAGHTGLEASYEETLSRADDSLYQNFFAQLFSGAGNLLVDAKDVRQGDIITTIEPEVQTRLAEDIAAVNARYHSRDSGGIIMDPRTGAIIAIAAYPTYDGNAIKDVDPAVLGNQLVEGAHEFGSIMKPLTMASALDAGAVTPDTTYNDTGCITVNTYKVCNWDHKARGVIPMAEIIKQSLNVGASWVATELGQVKMREYFTKLFGQKTGVDLPAEGHGIIKNLATHEQVNFDNMSFGQGIAITPVQMIRALGALANGGAMVRPHIVSGIQLSSGITRTLDWGGQTQVFSPVAVRETATMMQAVFDQKLDNGHAKIPTMSVSAKTGTAQLTKPGGGYYESGRWFHSEVDFFPSYNPRFIILLYTDDPQGVKYASETLTPALLDLTHFLIDYYDIPPDRGVASSTAAL
jgi:cell division protein FtsI/penicillin-binding protein 2